MSNELKPCPFCGNEPTLYQDEMTGHWAVRCVKDTHRPTLINSHGATAWCYSCTDPAEAIAAWNTRAERTCKDVGEHTDFCCSECGARLYTETNDGYTMIERDEETIIKMPRYCPSCGARVEP